MPRPAGARNKDFDAKRSTLIHTLTDYALQADLRRPSLRQFALAANASEPTLRHYFGDRKGLVISILEEIGHRGTPLWGTISTPAADSNSAILEYFRISEAGMRHGGFVRAHAFGIIEGVADEDVGSAYLQNVLEPALAAVSAKLRNTPGAPNNEDALRAAAFAALSPMLVISLHQDLLGGNVSDPVSVQTIFAHLQTWLSRGLMA